MNCPFCNPDSSEIILQNELVYARYDKYPVTTGHVLVIPFRHLSSYFDLTDKEVLSANNLVKQIKTKLLVKDASISGFNIGANIGIDAGQTIPHVHVHLIPRREGDIEDPTGGVRGVIPEKRIY